MLVDRDKDTCFRFEESVREYLFHRREFLGFDICLNALPRPFDVEVAFLNVLVDGEFLLRTIKLIEGSRGIESKRFDLGNQIADTKR